MKKLLFILMLTLTLVSCMNQSPSIVTNKSISDTIYKITSYKDSDLYLTKEQYLKLKETNQNNHRLVMETSNFYLILDGDSNNKVIVDEYTWKNTKEGDKYIE